MSAPTCRGCGAIIRWIKTEAGRNMPVDPEELTLWLTPDPIPGVNRVSLMTAEGKMLTGYPGTVLTPMVSEARGYVPHWGTCPKRADFKR